MRPLIHPMSKVFTYVKVGITIGWPLIAGAATLFGSYKAFLYEDITQKNLMQQNHKQIESLIRDTQRLDLTYKNINNLLSQRTLTIASLKDEINNLRVNLNKTIDYQQVIRKEVQDLAEGKLNTDEFWHYVNLIEQEERLNVGLNNSKS